MRISRFLSAATLFFVPLSYARAQTTSTPEPPPFAGSVDGFFVASKCPAPSIEYAKKLLVSTTKDAPRSLAADGVNTAEIQYLRLRGCWKGTLHEKSFTIDLYSLSDEGPTAGGVLVQYDSQWKGFLTDSPFVYRFTDESFCVGEDDEWFHTFAIFNIRSGELNSRKGETVGSIAPHDACPLTPPLNVTIGIPNRVLGLPKPYALDIQDPEPSKFAGKDVHWYAKKDCPAYPPARRWEDAWSFKFEGCWKGEMEGKPFTADFFDSTNNGVSYIILQYDGRLHKIGTEFPVVTRFTGETMCYLEGHAAGVRFYGGLNLRTAKEIDSDLAEDICGPTLRYKWPGIAREPKNPFGIGLYNPLPKAEKEDAP